MLTSYWVSAKLLRILVVGGPSPGPQALLHTLAPHRVWWLPVFHGPASRDLERHASPLSSAPAPG